MNIYERLIEILVEETIDPKVRARRKDAVKKARDARYHAMYQDLIGNREEPSEPGDLTPDPVLMKPKKERK